MRYKATVHFHPPHNISLKRHENRLKACRSRKTRCIGRQTVTNDSIIIITA